MPRAEAAVAATVASALGRTNRPEDLEALQQQIQHADARVRANVIDALTQRDHAWAVREQLDAMAVDDEPRPRASAIQALAGVAGTQAYHALSEMLRDPRPEHRRSAMWLVEQAGMLKQETTQQAASAEPPIGVGVPAVVKSDEQDVIALHAWLNELIGEMDSESGAAA